MEGFQSSLAKIYLENVSRGGENRNAMRLKLYSRIFVPFSSRKYSSYNTLCIRRVAFPVNFSEMGREWRIWALYIIYHVFRELLLTRLFRARRSRTRIRTVFLPSFLSLASTSPHGNVSFNPSLNTRRPFDFYGRKLRALARILVFYIYIHTRVCTHNGELEGRD